MSDSESLDYLQPGFDPKSLTIPRLRSILVAYNVPYSSSAKKAQLIEIFNEQIVPQSKKILAARARAKRSSKGIVDAEVEGGGNPFEEHEELAPPPPSTRRSRSPRKASTRIKSEEPDHQQMPPRAASPTKRKSRATSRQVQASDTDTGPELDGSTTLRRTRPSVEPPVPQPVPQPMPPPPQPFAAPQLKTEDSDEGFFRRTSGVFTNDNPFQSSSSPSFVDKTPTSRRRTAGPEKLRSTSSGAQHHTESYAIPRDHRPSPPIPPQNFGIPAKQGALFKTPDSPVLEVGEEFTPEEQLELAAEEAIQTDTEPSAPARQPRQPGGPGFGMILSIFFVTLLSVYAGWYRQEKIAVGYCGVGRLGSSIPSEIDVPEWAQSVLPPQVKVPQSVIDTLEPECEPCPPHAYCYADYSVRCEQDYILKPHPLSLGGIIPWPPTCEPDGEKVRRVQAVADRAIEELRDRAAKYECGEPIDEEGTRLETPAIEEQELKLIIDNKRSKKMNNQEFDDLWGAALGEIKARDEVQTEVKKDADPGGIPNTYLSSTSLARIPVACAIRRSVRLGLARYRLHISFVIAAALTVLYARSQYRAHRAAAAQVPGLVDLVLERLATQKRLGGDGEDGEDDAAVEPWLFLPNLRDDVLRSVHSLRQRDRIWGRVRAVVEQNSNVRTSQRESRSGEVGRAWEWIGPIGGGTGGSAPVAGDRANSWLRRRKSAGPGAAAAAAAGGDAAAAAAARRPKWEESRPIY
ncbi:Man1-Src1p-C-terminal domain-containing protein [Durotheca rogersii]|uniref:Man1-Src1p-C-terminal domain-containing protein n=1 Tax=Durotheca rogersii TaxID=419775 RepID=UPI00221F91EF|nr:Man1-Src1p-C-terminal domain-containing protein [Durotheca rogersii]KAI5867099.1 Man1-Src1p-C-terminal domain-containing protein [Durotheca rogersii]